MTIAQNWHYGIKSGLTIGAVIGPSTDGETSGQPLYSVGAAIFAGRSIAPKWHWQADLAYVRTGIFYQQSVPKTDTIYSQAIGTYLLDIPTFYTADVDGAFTMHYLSLPIKIVYQIHPKLQAKMGINASILLQGMHTGTAVTDIGTFAGDRTQFATEEEYAAALFIYQQANTYNESYAINQFDGGIIAGLEWQPIAPIGIFVDTQFSLSYLQQATPQIAVQFRNIYINAGISVYLSALLNKS